MSNDSNKSRQTQLSEAKRRLLQQRLNRKSKPEFAKKSLKRPASAPTIASAGQKRIWLMEQLNPGSPAYNLTSSYNFSGTLDANKLNVAFKKTLSRHDALRTVFKWDDGELHYHIHESLNTEIAVIETSNLDHSATQYSRTIFDLGQGPLLKLVILKTPENTGRILLVIHHIVFDEWSQNIFWSELQSLYNSSKTLPNPEYQFPDFAHWHNKKIANREFENQLEYWKKTLKGAPPYLNLPTKPGLTTLISDSGKIQNRRLSTKTTTAIKSLARTLNVSPSIPILIAFEILLYRYSNSNDISTGIPIANRPKKEFSQIIGFFLNTVVIRLNLDGDPTLKEILSTASRAVLEAIENQDIPFDTVVDAIKPERVKGRTPLIQSMFVYQKETDSTKNLNFDDVSLKPALSETRAAKLDLTLFATESETNIKLSIEYRKQVFEDTIIDGMLGHLENLIQSIVSNPNVRLSEVELLDATEKQNLLRLSTGPVIPIPKGHFLPEQIQRYAAVSPKTIAVATEGESINYEELGKRVNDLSNYLIGQLPKKQKAVALYMDRSIDAIVAILAILRCGAHYIPIDPTYPNSRVLSVFSDSRPAAIIADQKFHARLKAITPTLILSPKPHASAPHAPEALIQASDLAYIIYTSGSTGTPKGVAISHENLRQSTFSRHAYYKNKPECFLLLSSFSFDSSIAGIFWTLSSGGTLALPAPGDEKQPDRIRYLVDKFGVSTLLCIPSLYREIIATDQGKLDSLKTAIVAGENCPRSIVEDHYEHIPQCSLFNEYGPTEATVWCTATQLQKEQTVTIGRPIPNYQTFVLNQGQQQQPIGIPGELCIAGPGLAQAYLNNEELTNQRFPITDSITGSPLRYYRTGDYVRRLQTGEIEFLGRIDNQVKIRGFRIELGEIENALMRIRSIKEVAVEPIQYGSESLDEARLVAFIASSEATHLNIGTLRERLAERLPKHAIPAQFVFLNELPKLPNGKTNRNALVVPQNDSNEKTNITHRSSSTELKLVAIWNEIFPSQISGIDDNFFELGGSSLQAIRLFSRIKEIFNTTLSPSKLLQAPTIADLAQLIDKNDANSNLKNIIRLQEGTDLAPIILVHAAGQELIFYRSLVKRIDNRIPIFGIQPIGHDGTEAPTEDFEKIIERYTDEILAVQNSGPYRIIGHCQGGVFAMEIARRLKAKGHTVALIVSIDGEAPIIENTSLQSEEKSSPKFINHARRIARGIRWRFKRKIAHYQYRFYLKFGNQENKTKAIYKESFLSVTNSINRRRTKPLDLQVFVLRCRDSEIYPRHSDTEWRQAAPNAQFIKFDCLHDEILEEPYVIQTADCIMQQYFLYD